MNVSFSLSGLIHELVQLYRQISLDHFHTRMSDYHRDAGHDADSSADNIKTSLSRYIDNIDQSEKHKVKVTRTAPPADRRFVSFDIDKEHITNAHQGVYPFRRETRQDNANPYSLSRDQVGQLSKFFRASRKGVITRPGIKEKLRQSIWEHINTSIRYAHNGDSYSAKIHADIADNAFRELRHYMNEEEYSDLREKINQRLGKLKPNT